MIVCTDFKMHWKGFALLPLASEPSWCAAKKCYWRNISELNGLVSTGYHEGMCGSRLQKQQAVFPPLV